DLENATITSVGDSTVVIDTSPTTAGNQGLARSYPSATPICRVDVSTYTISTDGSVNALTLNSNQGSGAISAADSITGLTVSLVSSKQYSVTLTAQSETMDPVTRAYLTRSLTSNVTLKN